MENNIQITEENNLKKLEEAELEVTTFDEEVVVTSCEESCLAPGTKITMADGTLKNIEDIVQGDMVWAFDHMSGCFTNSEVLLAYKDDETKIKFTVEFADGTKLSIAGQHDLFEQESCKYVTLAVQNADQFIGKHFYNANEKKYVELVSVVIEEKTEFYELYIKNNFNAVANGMLVVADDMDYMLNIYEFDENLKADAAVLAADIQKYGLFEYNEKYGYSKEEYDAWNMRYLNIAVGKGLITWDKLWDQHFEYIDAKDGKSLSEIA